MSHFDHQNLISDELLIQQGIAGVKSGKFSSIYKAAKTLSISESTLRARFKGRKPRKKAHIAQQVLSKPEEDALCKWITTSTFMNMPPSIKMSKKKAKEIQEDLVALINDNSIERVHYPPLGKRWVQRFMNRYPQLKATRTRRIDAARLKESSSEVIINWLNAIKQLIIDHEILLENVYNMDESGFSIGSMQAECVIVDSTCNSAWQAQPGRQEWVTVLECICADGTSISPLIIFKGEKLSSEWIISARLPADWRFSCSNKGWTSNVHGLEWLRRCFEPATRQKADGKWRILICDGHESHTTSAFIAHCMKNNIMLLRLPPHTSHLVQPLDVGLFGPLKKYLSAELDPLVQAKISRILKVEWLLAFERARKRAFSVQNILCGWRGAGLFPWNPSKVLRHFSHSSSSSSSLQSSTPSNLLTTPDIFETSLVTSSPPDAEMLRSTNIALKEVISTKLLLQSPVRNYVLRLSHGFERLRADFSILKRKQKDQETLLGVRRNIKKGKRLALKDQLLLTTAELQNAVAAIENEAKSGGEKKKSRKRKSSTPVSETETNDDEEVIEQPVRKKRWVLDAVVV